MSDETIKSITASNHIITPKAIYYGNKTKVRFIGSCLKQDKFIWTHGKIVTINTVYEISKNYNISSYPTLENCLFGAVSWTKNNGIDRFKYSGYDIGFDRKGTCS